MLVFIHGHGSSFSRPSICADICCLIMLRVDNVMRRLQHHLHHEVTTLMTPPTHGKLHMSRWQDPLPGPAQHQRQPHHHRQQHQHPPISSSSSSSPSLTSCRHQSLPKIATACQRPHAYSFLCHDCQVRHLCFFRVSTSSCTFPGRLRGFKLPTDSAQEYRKSTRTRTRATRVRNMDHGLFVS